MANRINFIILGASGHAKVVAKAIESQADQLLGFYDDNNALQQQIIVGYPVLGPLVNIDSTYDRAVIAIGDNAVRRKVARANVLTWGTVIHQAAFVDVTAKLGIGTVVCAGAVIQPDVTIGSHCIINTSASIDHDCRIGDFVHIAPGVHLAGDVNVGTGAFLGIGCCVIPGVNIGANSIIGAGTVVLEDISENTTVVGVPARVI